MGEVEARGIAGSHDVGHVHVARRAPGDHGAAPVMFGALIEAGDSAGRHIARGLWLMIIGSAATIGGTAGRAHVIAGAFQQHDRKPDHLGMPQHVAPEPERNATGYSHELSSSSLSCNRAKAFIRGKYVGSCLGGSWPRNIERVLPRDPDEQHRVQSRRPLGTRGDAHAALGAGVGPSDSLRSRDLTVGEPAQPIGRRDRVRAAEPELIDDRTGVETGAARCA